MMKRMKKYYKKGVGWGHKVLFRGEIFYRGVNFVWENDYICSKIEAKRWECGIKKYQVTYTVSRIS